MAVYPPKEKNIVINGSSYDKLKVYTLDDFKTLSTRELRKLVTAHMYGMIRNTGHTNKEGLANSIYDKHNEIRQKILEHGNNGDEEKEEKEELENAPLVLLGEEYEEICLLSKQFEHLNIHIYGTCEDPLFIASDIGDVLGIKNIHDSVSSFDETEKKMLNVYTDKYTRKIKMLTKNGVCKLLCKSRKTGAIDISKQLGINVYNHKYECKETESITMILKTFKGEKMEQQYRISTYRIDLYFIEYNLCIECDEYNHMDRDMVYETERYNYISTMLNCKWIRYNPDDKNFNIFSILNEIFIIIKNNIQY